MRSSSTGARSPVTAFPWPNLGRVQGTACSSAASGVHAPMPHPPWRRLSDWKTQVHLVHRDDLNAELLDALELVDPVERLRATHPVWAQALMDGGHLRVLPETAKALNQAGVPTSTVGYHRGVDQLSLGQDGPGGGPPTHVDAALIWGELPDDDPDDVVDALLRLHTEGLLTEAGVLVATASPALDHGAVPLDLPDLDPGALPELDPALLDRVAAALATPATPGPDAPRRVHRLSALGLTAAGLALTAGGLWVEWLAVVGAPVLALGGVVLAVQVALW